MFTTRKNLVSLIGQAIALENNYYTKGSAARRNKNPGALRPEGKTKIVKFADEAEGWAVLEGNLKSDIFTNKLTCQELCATRQLNAEFVINYLNKALGNAASANIKLYQLVQ